MQTQSLPCQQRHPCEKPPPDWRQRLPRHWRPAVVPPLRFEIQREYEAAAFRLYGFDDDGGPCYYHQRYLLNALRSDDDESLYSALVYGEEVEAWRLKDGRWLVWQWSTRERDEGSTRGFFSFREEKPA